MDVLVSRRTAALVSTNSMRDGAIRKVLDQVTADAEFRCMADEPWIVEDTAVRISPVCFERRDAEAAILPMRGRRAAAERGAA